MFKNWKIEAKLVPASKTTSEIEPEPQEPIDYLAIATEAGKRLLVGVVITSAVVFGLSTLSQITVNRLQSEKYED